MSGHGDLVERLRLLRHAMPRTTVRELAHERIDLHAKLEFENTIGSIKDRPALWILQKAIERGEIERTTTIVESSSGNFAIALAAHCAFLGLRFIPVIDPNVPQAYQAFLDATCDTVVKVTESDAAGGYLHARLERTKQLCAEIPGAYWTNQTGNLDALGAHYHLTGAELLEQVPGLDYVFVGVGSGGTISGVSRRLKEHDPRIRVIAVDIRGSVIFGGAPRRRYISGIGSAIRPALVDEAQIDEVIEIGCLEAARGCHQLLERHRIFAGGSTGAVYAAIERYFAGAPLGRRPRVAFLCADRGTAYVGTIYNPAWVRRLEAPLAGHAHA